MGLDPYETHLPALLSCLAVTTGPVLEVGIGEFSTPLLHAACVQRGLVSVEADADWFHKFAEIFRRYNHDFIFSPVYNALPNLAQQNWSVVFIDHSPGIRRVPDALLFRKRADYIVIHDYEPGEPIAGEDLVRVDPVKHLFPYWKACQRYYPYTMVLGNKEIPEII